MKKYFNKNLVEKEFKRIDKCHNGNGDKSVRGHNHITGRYTGSAQNDCNLKFKLSKKIPVIFHDLREYNSHPVTEEIGRLLVDI